MESILHEGKTFEGIDFTVERPTAREFAGCVFINCNFSKANLANDDFVDCQFRACNLSLATLDNACLKNIQFTGCKMVGIDFSRCNNFNFSVSFHDCPLDYCSFFQKKMKKTVFNNCSMKECDFTETDLTQAAFAGCDLQQAIFMRSVLEKADFRTAIHYTIDPDLNRIKKAKFSLAGIEGLLHKYELDIS